MLYCILIGQGLSYVCDTIRTFQKTSTDLYDQAADLVETIFKQSMLLVLNILLLSKQIVKFTTAVLINGQFYISVT